MNVHPLTWMLDQESDAAHRASPSPPIHSPALCAGFAGNRQGCDACLQACPHAAISHADCRVLVDPSVCQRCGACVAACPTGALQRSFLGDDELFAALQAAHDECPDQPPVAVLQCVHGEHLEMRERPSPRPGMVEFAVPSVHLFSEVHLLATVAVGYRGVLLVACPQCEKERSLDHPDQMVDLANRLLRCWGIPGTRIRRSLFLDEETGQWAEALSRLDGPTWTPLSGAFSKRELLAELAEFFQGSRGTCRRVPEAKPTDSYAEVDVRQDACTLCGACARVCPTGALSLTVDEGLAFRPLDCVACGLCQASCAEEAIEVRQHLPEWPESGRRRVLKQSTWLTCPDCGTTTSSREYLQRLEQRLADSPVYQLQENRELLRLCEPCKSRRTLAALPQDFSGAGELDHGGRPAVPSPTRTPSQIAGPTSSPIGSVSLPVVSPQPVAWNCGRSAGADAPASSDLSRRNFVRWAASIAAATGFVARGEPAGALEGNAAEESGDALLPEWTPELIDQNALIRMQVDLARALDKPRAARRWVMVIDIGRCVGCHACTIACVAENQLPPGVVYRPVIEEETGTYPNVRRRFIPRPCMQCEEPPCVPVCPVDATWKREDGITVIDYNKCIGCRYCLTACPYSARVTDFGEFYSDDTPAQQPYELLANFEYRSRWNRSEHGSPVGNARKCHFCIHRIEEGMLPACVTTCIGIATYFGDANDPESLVSELIASSRAQRLKEEMGTRPNVYYLM